MISSFGIYSGLKSLVKSGKEKTKWTQTDRDNQVKECIRLTKELGEKYPEIVKDYCECSTDKVISSMTKQEYNKITSLPVDEQKRKITPIIKDCIDTLEKRIQKAELKNLENLIYNVSKRK